MNIFIGCTSDKKSSPCKAEDMYMPSSLYRKALTYAKKVLKGDHIYILSAKYHLLPLSKHISPYNQYLGDFSAEEKQKWYDETISQMKSHHINFNEKTVFLCGEDYYKGLKDEFSNADCPYGRQEGIGYVLKWLTKKIKGVDEIKESMVSLYDYVYATLNEQEELD